MQCNTHGSKRRVKSHSNGYDLGEQYLFDSHCCIFRLVEHDGFPTEFKFDVPQRRRSGRRGQGI